MVDVASRSTPGALAFLEQFLRFALRILRGFVKNGGLELAGALAYNALLSVVPILLLVTAIFSRFVERQRFIRVVAREIRQLLPAAQAKPITEAIVGMLAEPFSGGLFGLAMLIFFSTLAFRTLEHALDVIFVHRRETHEPRSLAKSILISLGYVTAIGLASFVQTLALVGLDRFPGLAENVPRWAGFLGPIGLALVLATIYWVMPPGKSSARAALIGGVIATLLWQAVQALSIWYFANISSVNLIYGSLAGIVVVLFSLELSAAIVLLVAQAIAEIEKSRLAGLHWSDPAPAIRSIQPARKVS